MLLLPHFLYNLNTPKYSLADRDVTNVFSTLSLDHQPRYVYWLSEVFVCNVVTKTGILDYGYLLTKGIYEVRIY